MNLFPTTLRDILRLLVQPLHVAAVFPAAVCTLITVHVVIPIVYSDFPKSTWSIPASLIAIIVLSYLLYVLNGPLIRFAEGYTFEWTVVGKRKKRKGFVLPIATKLEGKFRQVLCRRTLQLHSRGSSTSTEKWHYKSTSRNHCLWQIFRITKKPI